jgi:hypothetical protein
MRRFVLLLALLLGSVVVTPSTSSAATLKPDSCRDSQPMVVDVTLTARNIADIAGDENVWALDQYTEHVQAWQIGPHLYCVRRAETGTWTSFAGASPAGSGTISGGLTGTLHGVRYLRVMGTFDPAYPTTGYIGEFEALCDQFGDCPGIEPLMSTLYFSQVNNLDFGQYDFVAESDAHGTWHQSPDGDTGDITD